MIKASVRDVRNSLDVTKFKKTFIFCYIFFSPNSKPYFSTILWVIFGDVQFFYF